MTLLLTLIIGILILYIISLHRSLKQAELMNHLILTAIVNGDVEVTLIEEDE